MEAPGHQTSILYSTPNEDIFIIDIPVSIQLAQGNSYHPWTKRIISKAPLHKPLPSTEPKTEKARQIILSRGQGRSPDELVESVKTTLQSLQYTGPFNLPRVHATSSQGTVSTLFASLIHYSRAFSANTPPTFQLPQTSPTWHRWTPAHSNRNAHSIQLHIQTPSSSTISRFHIPPHSTLLLDALPFASPALAPVPSTGFDLVLLDPPWPNRSVHRSSSYTTATSFEAMSHQLDRLNLPMYLAHSGHAIIAIWITNSNRVHDLVRGKGGWLARMDMSVFEEWIWVKVTSRGEPVTPLDGLWRKPYETLLLARQNDNHPDVKRRVLFAVPDLHSRKPCLKELFEKLIVPKPQHLLEIYARNATAGWHSWGDEVLKFNWEGHWTDDSPEAQTLTDELSRCGNNC